MCLVRGVFCFKQKTAYEMRISDWSSDVCSSDLAAKAMLRPLVAADFISMEDPPDGRRGRRPARQARHRSARGRRPGGQLRRLCADRQPGLRVWPASHEGRQAPIPGQRSEEHTSELQSLMRISYAVFCLTKKKI